VLFFICSSGVSFATNLNQIRPVFSENQMTKNPVVIIIEILQCF